MFVSGKFILFAIAVGLGVPTVKGIISNTYPKKSEQDSGSVQRQDNEIAQSLDREYLADFEHKYKGREGLGLSDHADKHFEGGVEDYEGFKGDKYYHKFGQGSHYGDGHLLHHHHYHDHFDHHKPHHDDIGYHKALAIKGLLVPLAGVALLGAAAAFISNPVLLQLGIISGAPLGRRKRDATEQLNISFEDKTRSNQIKLLENFMAKMPEEKIRIQEKKWLADYLSCSGMNNKLCIDRLACELYSPRGKSMPIEAEVLTIVVNEILKNDFITQGTKVEILQAIEAGRNNLTCDMFFCAELEKQTKSQESRPSIKKKRINLSFL